MKLLAKKIFNSNFFLFFRNNLNIKPSKINIFNLNYSASISDSFCWRTDNKFETIFRFSDIFKNFYKISNSMVTLFFYDKKGNLIKEVELQNLKQSNNEFKIDKIFLDGLEDYGTFHIYHKLKDNIKEKVLISNRCYTGFSKNNALPSFMHGNTFSSYIYLNGDIKKYSNIVKKKIFSNSTYKIQNYFNGYDHTELFFSNPTNEKIHFFLNNDYFELNKNASLVINTKGIKIFTIKSNCLFLRPAIFNYKNNYLDVFHA